jgi:carboxymethylenebutenolidase
VQVKSRSIEIEAPDGVMSAHLAEPDGSGPFPAIVVLMEAFGLVPHIRSVADRLTGEGYVALAPDVYYRQAPDNVVGYDQLDQAIALMQRVDDAKFVADLEAALGFLDVRENVLSSKIGVTGFCMGGRLAFLAACELPDRVSAVAPFYGGGIAGHLERADRIRAPLLLFFGENDAFIPLDQVTAVRAKLDELDKEHRIKVYPGAGHGFFCDARESYDAAAAGDAWNQLTRFFAANLGPESG